MSEINQSAKAVYINGDTIVDLGDTTVVSSEVPVGKTFYNNKGVKTEGAKAPERELVIGRLNVDLDNKTYRASDYPNVDAWDIVVVPPFEGGGPGVNPGDLPELAPKVINNLDQDAYVAYDDGLAGYSRVDLKVKATTLPVGDNGTYYAPEGVVYDTVVVGVSKRVATEPLQVTENNTRYVASENGLDGYSVVDIAVPTTAALGTLRIENNGVFTVADDERGLDGYTEITVQVDSEATGALGTLDTKQITENGTYNAFDDGLAGYSGVLVSVSPKLGEKQITTDGTYVAAQDTTFEGGIQGYSAVIVDTSSQLMEKPIYENGTYLAAEDGKLGYSSVTVNVVPKIKQDYLIQSNGDYDPAMFDGAVGFGKLKVSVPTNGGSSAITAISTEEEMENIRMNSSSEDHNKIVLYSGPTTDSYVGQAYYRLEVR